MIAALKRAYAAFRGFDDETGSAPMMDGPLRPNALLDAARVALALPDVDNLTLHRGELVCSSGKEILRLSPDRGDLTISDRRAFDAAVSFIAAGPGDSLAVGLDGRGVLIAEGPHAGRMIKAAGGRGLTCPTAGLFLDPNRLVVASGAAAVTAADWKRDLMERGASGQCGSSTFPAPIPRRSRSPKASLSRPDLRARATAGFSVSETWLPSGDRARH